MDKPFPSPSSGKNLKTNEEVSGKPPVYVEASPEFSRNLKTLKKRYPNIRKDVEPLLAQLESGEVLGDHIQNKEYSLFKVRVKNSDIQKGKSGGYRFIYYLKTPEDILLVTIYSKSDFVDIPIKRIVEIIKECSRE